MSTIHMKSDGLPVIEVQDEIRVGADRDGVFVSLTGQNHDAADGSQVSASVVISPSAAKALIVGLKTVVGAIEGDPVLTPEQEERLVRDALDDAVQKYLSEMVADGTAIDHGDGTYSKAV